jgi:predicted AlkP superfamily phosphohydrolase/phosphomutase
MSDHGFTPVKGTFLVNQWLADNGLLKKNRLFGEIPSTWVHLLGHRRHGFVSRLKYLISSVVSTASRGRLLDYPRMSINFQKSRVFARPAPVLFINRRDRWPQGMVEAGEGYEKLKRSVCEKLGALRDPETGEKIVGDACMKDDVYSGECLEDAPDIVLLPRDEGYDFLALESYHSHIKVGAIRKSCHSMNGIFFLAGEGVQKGEKSGVVQMVDCMPTVLHLLDVPIPEDVDGRILRELFVDGSAAALREAKRQGSSQIGERELEKVSEKDERLIEDRLRDLGYMS